MFASRVKAQTLHNWLRFHVVFTIEARLMEQLVSEILSGDIITNEITLKSSSWKEKTSFIFTFYCLNQGFSTLSLLIF